MLTGCANGVRNAAEHAIATATPTAAGLIPAWIAALTAMGPTTSAVTWPPITWVNITVNRYKPAIRTSGPAGARPTRKAFPIFSASPVASSAVPIGNIPPIRTTTFQSTDRYASSMVRQPINTSKVTPAIIASAVGTRFTAARERTAPVINNAAMAWTVGEIGLGAG